MGLRPVAAREPVDGVVEALAAALREADDDPAPSGARQQVVRKRPVVASVPQHARGGGGAVSVALNAEQEVAGAGRTGPRRDLEEGVREGKAHEPPAALALADPEGEAGEVPPQRGLGGRVFQVRHRLSPAA